MTAAARTASDTGYRRDAGVSSPQQLIASDRVVLMAFLLGLLLLRLVLMVWIPLTDTTEARYAEIARKMVETGDWITPQFDYGVPFWGKPPLHTWAAALGMKLFGVYPFCGRIFILAASLAVLWLMFDWARQRRQTDLGLVAVTICASSALFFGASAFVMTDMVMTLGTTLSMVSFYRAVSRDGGARLWGLLFFVGLAIGMLAKGPTAVVLTAIPIVLWVSVGRRWHMLARLPWGSGLLLAASLTLPWYIAAELKTPGFLSYFLIGEHIQRFLSPGWKGDLYGTGKEAARGMIWIYAIGALLPWSIFAGGLLLRRVQSGSVPRSADADWLSYLAFWSLSPLILFTLAANILAAYVLPAIPAMSLLLAARWGHTFGFAPTWVRGAFMLCAILSLTVFSLGGGAARYAPEMLNLKTMDLLIQQAKEAGPDVTINHYPLRSFSAEFYTAGAVKTLTSLDALRALVDNGRRDAIIVPTPEAAVSELMEPGVRELARTERYTLFVEPAK